MSNDNQWVDGIDWPIPADEAEIQNQNEKLQLMETYDLFETKEENESALFVTSVIKELRKTQLQATKCLQKHIIENQNTLK